MIPINDKNINPILPQSYMYILYNASSRYARNVFVYPDVKLMNRLYTQIILRSKTYQNMVESTNKYT